MAASNAHHEFDQFAVAAWYACMPETRNITEIQQCLPGSGSLLRAVKIKMGFAALQAHEAPMGGGC